MKNGPQDGLSTFSNLILLSLLGLVLFGYTHYTRQQQQLGLVSKIKDQMQEWHTSLDKSFNRNLCELNAYNAFEGVSLLKDSTIISENYHKITTSGGKQIPLVIVNQSQLDGKLWVEGVNYHLSDIRPASLGGWNTQGLLSIELHLKRCSNGGEVYSIADSPIKDNCSPEHRFLTSTLTFKRLVLMNLDQNGAILAANALKCEPL